MSSRSAGTGKPKDTEKQSVYGEGNGERSNTVSRGVFVEQQKNCSFHEQRLAEQDKLAERSRVEKRGAPFLKEYDHLETAQIFSVISI